MNTSRRRPTRGITATQLEAKVKEIVTKLKICPAHGKCRAHIFPKPNYDSGWRSVAKGQSLTLVHNLRGNVDKYLVDLQAKNSAIINFGYGGDEFRQAYRDSNDNTWFEQHLKGFYYSGLNTRSIKVNRQTHNLTTDKIRVRIWAYD